MIATFLIFCLIWLLLSAFGTFMGYGILYPRVPLFTIGTCATLIAWCIAFIFTLIRSVSKKEIDLVQQEMANASKYKDHKGSTASRIIGANTIPGHLYIFPEELVFHPGGLREEKEDWTLPYSSITDVYVDEETKKLCFELTGGAKEFFAVPDRQRWIRDINEIQTTRQEQDEP